MDASLTEVTTRIKIVLGIDYGTTFSGVSYVTTDKSGLDDISIIVSWNGGGGTSSKTPTRIAYASENPRLQRNKWGFQVDPKLISYSWTKLLLDKSATVGKYDDPSLYKMAGTGILQLPPFRDASGVCEDFLREVYTYVSDKLSAEFTKDTFDTMPMECWITLPAIWSDEAKDATLAAAKKAGFGNRVGDEIFTIAEPEAAAIAALKGYAAPNAPNPIKPKENVLICDCGGGTVDITTYAITQVSPQLTFDELQVGAGGKCGSTYIDRNLHLLMSRRFGKSFEDLPFSQKGPGSRFMTEFETHKKSFGLSDGRENCEIGPIRLDVPGSEYFDEDERSVILTYEDMQTLFDPVISDITSLLSEQVEEAKMKKNVTIDRVILVGGFAESPYLHNALEQWCWKNDEIVLIRPANPQSAVLRGAALRGLEGLAPRIKHARRHYGVSGGFLFRENIDPENRSYLDSMDNRKYCSGRMEWLISKGEEIAQGTFRTSSWRRKYSPGAEHNFEETLYQCSLVHAPEYDDDPRVEKVGVIRTRFPASYDFGTGIISKVNPVSGKQIHEFSYETQVVFGSKGSNLTFRTVVNGNVVSTADIVFDQS